MSPNRGGGRVTHAARWLAVRLEQNRLEPRVRRMLNKLQRELHANTWETLRALILGRVARRELLAQQREAALLADPTAEAGTWLIGLWAAQRRDVELLALLERLEDGDKTPTLADYLAAHSTSTAVNPSLTVGAAPPAPGAAAVVPPAAAAPTPHSEESQP